jgi:hypothetical protein
VKICIPHRNASPLPILLLKLYKPGGAVWWGTEISLEVEMHTPSVLNWNRRVIQHNEPACRKYIDSFSIKQAGFGTGRTVGCCKKGCDRLRECFKRKHPYT